jgi:MFS family permease
MTPMSLMIMLAAPISGKLSDRFGSRWILVSGLTLMSVGILFIISRINLETTWITLLPALIVTGLGMGMTFAPMTAAAMREVPLRISGSASGILNTSRNVGQVLGIAVLGSLLQSRLGVHATDRLADVPLDPSVKAQLVQVVKDSRFEVIGQVIPQAQANLLPAIFNDVQLAFVDSLHNTFVVGALACALGALSALLIHNPARIDAEPAHSVAPEVRESERELLEVGGRPS